MKGFLCFLTMCLGTPAAFAHGTTFRSVCFMQTALPGVRAEIERELGVRTARIFLNINVPGAFIPSVGSQEFQQIRQEGRAEILHRTILEIPERRDQLVLTESVYDRITNRCTHQHSELIEAARLEHFKQLGRYVLRLKDGQEIPTRN